MDFKAHGVFDGDPVEVYVDWGELDILQFVELFGRKEEEDAIAVIKSRHDKDMDQGFGGEEGERWTET